MDWDRIRIFLEVARTGQILGAARRLGVNHATVARQLTALEQELKTRLVERRTTGCVLTSAGEALVTAAERAESEFLQVGAHLGRSSEAISGTVRVRARKIHEQALRVRKRGGTDGGGEGRPRRGNTARLRRTTIS